MSSTIRNCHSAYDINGHDNDNDNDNDNNNDNDNDNYDNYDNDQRRTMKILQVNLHKHRE